MPALHIYDPRERAIVGAADGVLGVLAGVSRPFRRRVPPEAPRRILLLRLERIGDLLMALPGIADVRAFAPQAEIDLAVGSWNADVARSIAGIDRIETLDASWLARENEGQSLVTMMRAAASRWRRRRYDLAINFEPDLRSNALAALSGARWTAGYRSAGGGPLLDQALDYDTKRHTSDNARILASTVFRRESPPLSGTLLDPPAEQRRAAGALIGQASRPLIAMHVPGGRPVKQWPPERFAEVAAGLIAKRGATVLLTGGAADRAMVDGVRRSLPPANVIDASGSLDLLTLAAVLEQCDLVITGDTGPMHVAAAVGTPIVAVFGPSDPSRYAPRGPRDRVVRVDLPCAPCNQIRLPPARCRGVTPDCLTLIGPDRVLDAALAILTTSP